MKDKKILMPAVIAVVAVVILAGLIRNHQAHCLPCFPLKSFSPEVIKHYILGFGPWALGVYIVLYTLNTVSLLPPIGVMSLAAGFIFGPVLGAVGIMVGSWIGTSVTFYISRIFGRRFVEKMMTPKVREFEEKLNQKGFVTILFIRLIPLIPWEVVNYASGFSQIRYRDYILATLLGIFPSVIIQTYFSDRLSHFDIRDPKLIAAIVGFVFLISVPTMYLAFRKKARIKDAAV